MGSGRRKFIWILCSLLLLEATSAKNIWKRALHARLAKRSHRLSLGLKTECCVSTVNNQRSPKCNYAVAQFLSHSITYAKGTCVVGTLAIEELLHLLIRHPPVGSWKPAMAGVPAHGHWPRLYLRAGC